MGRAGFIRAGRDKRKREKESERKREERGWLREVTLRGWRERGEEEEDDDGDEEEDEEEEDDDDEDDGRTGEEVKGRLERD